MAKIIKYWPLAFLICNICEQTFLLRTIASPLFYVLMGLSIVIVINRGHIVFSNSTSKIFPFFYSLIFIYLLYTILFGWENSNSKSWVYLIAKIFSILALVVSILEYPEFNRRQMFVFSAYFICVLTVIGHFVNNISFNGRQGLGFLNPNSMGALAALSFGVLWIYPRLQKRKCLYYLACIMLLIAVLQSGSRTAMSMVVLLLVIRYGINLKLILWSMLFFIAMIFVMPKIGIEITALNRLVETVQSGNVSDGRENEREAAWVMIRDKPISGNGLYATQSEESLRISMYGSHNGYLDFCKMLGLPLAGLLILILALDYLSLLRNTFRDKSSDVKVVIFVSTSVMLAAFNEAYLWGVNQPVTTFFYIAFGGWAYLCRDNDEQENKGQQWQEYS